MLNRSNVPVDDTANFKEIDKIENHLIDYSCRIDRMNLNWKTDKSVLHTSLDFRFETPICFFKDIIHKKDIEFSLYSGH